MIDKKARTIALNILNRVKTEKLTNWQFEDEWPKSKIDPAVNCIYRWLWTFYDDGTEEVLIEKLTNNAKKIFDRCCDFLETDIEFPVNKNLVPSAEKNLKHQWGMEWRTDCTLPEDDYWPFPSKF